MSRSDLATACGVSTVSVGKWINNDSKNMKMENLFMAADLCLVNAKWLAIGAGNPSTGVPTIYADVSGPDLQIARDLTKLDDRGTRTVVRELIAAKTNAAAGPSEKMGKRSKSR